MRRALLFIALALGLVGPRLFPVARVQPPPVPPGFESDLNSNNAMRLGEELDEGERHNTSMNATPDVSTTTEKRRPRSSWTRIIQLPEYLRSSVASRWKGRYTPSPKGVTMKKLSLLGVLLLGLVLAPSAGSQYYYGCQGYSNSRVVYWSSCGCYTCGYTGSGCTVCFDESSGETCYTNAQYCGPLHQTP